MDSIRCSAREAGRSVKEVETSVAVAVESTVVAAAAVMDVAGDGEATTVTGELPGPAVARLVGRTSRRYSPSTERGVILASSTAQRTCTQRHCGVFRS